MKRLWIIALGGMLIAGFPTFAEAQESALSDATLLCSVGHLRVCPRGEACSTVDHDDYEAPRFLIIDFENRLIVSTDPAQAGRRDQIRWLERLEDRLIIQGTDNDRAFSIVISEVDAGMTETTVGDGFALVATGDCIPAKEPYRSN